MYGSMKHGNTYYGNVLPQNFVSHIFNIIYVIGTVITTSKWVLIYLFFWVMVVVN
jgi:hypothetical protein